MIRSLLIVAATCVLVAPVANAAGDAAAGKEKAEVCKQCHGDDGNSPTPIFPKIGGQHAKYIVQALEDYRTGVRKDPVMAAFAVALSKQDQEDLAAWYESQTSGGLYTINFTE